MSHASHNETNPLLNTPLKPKTEPADEPVSAGTLYAIKALSYVRIAGGAACLVAPQFACALFQYNVPVGSALLVRMVGARDGVLGGLLLTAEDKKAHDGGRREMRRGLWTGIAADAIDIGSLAYAVAKGHVGQPTGGLFGAGAVVFIGLGAWGLRGLRG
ncbi:hypothetical protein BU25DRAFT_31760 [Macroventuria anomochaeta]|uniref:Uncharacterized protein n=1 Tax=Macroventuria anomochaeta TaxID=301207 RepID=A0ACB6S3Z1_9PLEO|nr:uncharacterized protein BU25DRAFT_31760 [Macroventuria anomochaeta]KAF2628759.1 hypothetical protein BU25DRAFT_31760 [Macroventuria anomochaeta]